MANESRVPTLSDLINLPPRAIVLYAARAARRSLPLYQLPADAVGLADRIRHYRELQNAVRYAEVFNLGRHAATSVRDAVRDVGRAAQSAVDVAVVGAVDAALSAAVFANQADRAVAADTAAASAAEAADSAAFAVNSAFAAESASNVSQAATFRDAIASDFKILAAVDSKDIGKLDLSEAGPLGPLWPYGPPDWYRPALERIEAVLRSADRYRIGGDKGRPPIVESESSGLEPLTVYVDAGAADAETIRDLFLALSALYESQGGAGLKIVKHSQGTLVVQEVPV